MTGCLLDTHALIWLTSDKARLSRRVRTRIERPDSEICVSVIRIWEILIKHLLGRLWTSKDVSDFIDRIQREAEWRIVSLQPSHLAALSDLPFFEDHKDPFDRLLIAQAIHEKPDIVTADPHFSRYGVKVIW